MKEEELGLMIEAFIKMLKDNGFLAVEVDVLAYDSDVTLHHIQKEHKVICNLPYYKKMKEEAK